MSIDHQRVIQTLMVNLLFHFFRQALKGAVGGGTGGELQPVQQHAAHPQQGKPTFTSF